MGYLGFRGLMIYLSRMQRLLVICLFIIPTLSLSQARRALSLIDKEKTDEAYNLLTKAIAKDSLASAEQYALAQLLFMQDYKNYDLDSAYYYVLLAIETYGKSEVKVQEKLNKSGFSPESYDQLKREIESAGFHRAKDGGQEQDYIDFLTEFPTSIQADSAIMLRNKAAFLIAEQKNTYHSYKNFFNTYPEAIEVSEARKRYEKLLYEAKTADGKLNTYRQFLRDYPDTWHRQEAEQHIYDILTGRNSIESYKLFIDEYPQSFLSHQALLIQYTLLDEQKKAKFLANGVLSAGVRDSIKSLTRLNHELLIPVVNNHNYQVVNTRGEIILDNLTNISELNKCSLTITKVILGSTGDENQLLALDGSILARGDIISVNNEGRGLYKITTPRFKYFINEAGFRTNNHNFAEAYRTGPFIAYKERSKWGLESVTGIAIIEPKYDSIAEFFDHIIFRKGKKWGIYRDKELYPGLDGEEVEFKLIYDEILPMGSENILLTLGKKVSLLDKEGNTLVPMEKQFIEIVEGGYFVDRSDSVLDSRVADKWYYNISSNDNWIIGERRNGSDVYYNDSLLFKTDKARINGNSMALVSVGDSTFAYFNDTTKLFIGKDELILPVNRMGQNSTVRHYLFSAPKTRPVVYNQAGQVVELDKFDKLVDLGNEYILSKYRGSYQLLLDSGKVVLQDIDAATSLKNGYISFLVGNKFGLFNAKDGTMIEATYDRPLRAYSDSLFITSKEGKYGIIDRRDSLLVPALYSEIRYLNDTVAILNHNFRWIFWDIAHNRPLLDNVSDFWISDAAGKMIYKVLKGIGYGIWTVESGTILNSTYSEINIVTKGVETVFIGEKWVEEADIVILLYYDGTGKLFRKDVLSTAEYEDLTCKTEQD
jgi:hypothetical protein